MSEATIRARLDTILSGVSNIGKVHSYDRFSSDWSSFLDLFKATIGGTDQIRGWAISYNGNSAPGDDPREFGNRWVRSQRFLIRGYMGLDDSAATEKTFAALAESVQSAIDGDTTLYAQGTYYETPPTEIRVFDLRLFGSVLCHYCEILVTVKEFVDE